MLVLVFVVVLVVVGRMSCSAEARLCSIDVMLSIISFNCARPNTVGDDGVLSAVLVMFVIVVVVIHALAAWWLVARVSIKKALCDYFLCGRTKIPPTPFK